MSLVILHNETHQHLKVDTKPATEYGDNINRALAYSTEIADLHKEFPLLIAKNPENGKLCAHAIMGLQKDENLFLENGRWTCATVPATMARGPFSIGYQEQEVDGVKTQNPMIMVDEKDPRISDNGAEVFLEFGGESPYLQFVKKVLSVIDSGHRNDEVFYATLEEMELLEPVDINLSLSEQQHFGFKDYMSINQEKLSQLSGEQLVKLRDMGILAQVYFLLSSLGNFQRLIDKKNALQNAQ